MTRSTFGTENLLFGTRAPQYSFMWEEVARDILKNLHRANSVYRVLDRNGRDSATVAVPMNGNLLSAFDVDSALDQCEFARNALINMRESRIEFYLSATPEGQLNGKTDETKPTLDFDTELVAGADLINVRHAAQTIAAASTTGVLPRIEIEFDSTHACMVYGCNKNCVFDHSCICKDLDPALLTYNFNNLEVMYRVDLSETRPGKRRKK